MKIKCLVVLSILIGLVIFLVHFFKVEQSILDFIISIDEIGFPAILIFSGTFIMATVLFFPRSVLNLGAGFAFGLVKGSIIISIATTLSALATFLIGKYIFRNRISDRIREKRLILLVNSTVRRKGWKIVSLLRIVPFLPFNLSNLAYSQTDVSLKSYCLGTFLGLFPGILIQVYLGTISNSIVGTGTIQSKTTLEWIIYLVGFFIAAGIVLYLTIRAGRSIREETSKLENKENTSSRALLIAKFFPYVSY